MHHAWILDAPKNQQKKIFNVDFEAQSSMVKLYGKKRVFESNSNSKKLEVGGH